MILEKVFKLITELNKVEQEISKGNISLPKDPNQKADYLKKIGVRSKDQYIGGIVRGNENLQKKSNIKIKKSLMGNLVGPHYRPDQNVINIPKGSSLLSLNPIRQYRLSQDIPHVIRHELNEKAVLRKNPTMTSFVHNNKLVGRHAGPEVLRREKQLIDFTSKAYDGEGSGNQLKKFREKSGEYGYIGNKTKKQLDSDLKKSEKQTVRNIDRLERFTSKKIAPLAASDSIKNRLKAIGTGISIQSKLKDPGLKLNRLTAMSSFFGRPRLARIKV